MGGVAVLQPQDYLKNRLPPNNYYPTMKSRPNQKRPNFAKSNRSKRSPTRTAGGNNHTPAVSNLPAKSLVMGHVKLLKRGEPLTEAKSPKDLASYGEKPKPRPKVEKICDASKPKVEEIFDLGLSTTDRFGPDPGLVPKKINIAELYAGSGFFDSPPPSSLPLPAFFTKKCSVLTKVDPTADLRRILGLDRH